MKCAENYIISQTAGNTDNTVEHYQCFEMWLGLVEYTTQMLNLNTQKEI